MRAGVPLLEAAELGQRPNSWARLWEPRMHVSSPRAACDSPASAWFSPRSRSTSARSRARGSSVPPAGSWQRARSAALPSSRPAWWMFRSSRTLSLWSVTASALALAIHCWCWCSCARAAALARLASKVTTCNLSSPFRSWLRKCSASSSRLLRSMQRGLNAKLCVWPGGASTEAKSPTSGCSRAPVSPPANASAKRLGAICCGGGCHRASSTICCRRSVDICKSATVQTCTMCVTRCSSSIAMACSCLRLSSSNCGARGLADACVAIGDMYCVANDSAAAAAASAATASDTDRGVCSSEVDQAEPRSDLLGDSVSGVGGADQGAVRGSFGNTHVSGNHSCVCCTAVPAASLRTEAPRYS
mmetsp:Transcript_30823/g.88576  ORF Transcript_30823/g.88576 Transcript_30823/m.88576 type:complete len:360 (+) Transcript_30823:206-1285(+)